MKKVNIDLDSLTFGKQQQKPQSLSMNQMQKQTSITSPVSPPGKTSCNNFSSSTANASRCR